MDNKSVGSEKNTRNKSNLTYREKYGLISKEYKNTILNNETSFTLDDLLELNDEDKELATLSKENLRNIHKLLKKLQEHEEDMMLADLFGINANKVEIVALVSAYELSPKALGKLNSFGINTNKELLTLTKRELKSLVPRCFIAEYLEIVLNQEVKNNFDNRKFTYGYEEMIANKCKMLLSQISNNRKSVLINDLRKVYRKKGIYIEKCNLTLEQYLNKCIDEKVTSWDVFGFLNWCCRDVENVIIKAVNSDIDEGFWERLRFPPWFSEDVKTEIIKASGNEDNIKSFDTALCRAMTRGRIEDICRIYNYQITADEVRIKVRPRYLSRARSSRVDIFLKISIIRYFLKLELYTIALDLNEKYILEKEQLREYFKSDDIALEIFMLKIAQRPGYAASPDTVPCSYGCYLLGKVDFDKLMNKLKIPNKFKIDEYEKYQTDAIEKFDIDKHVFDVLISIEYEKKSDYFCKRKWK